MTHSEAKNDWSNLDDTQKLSVLHQYIHDIGELRMVIEKDSNYFQKLKAIGKYYQVQQHKPDIEWEKILTPIELDAFYSMMGIGINAYPQYPVLKYHLDFALPKYKIGIELDGAKYHNPEKDSIRDFELFKAGWRIFRISGKEMFNPMANPSYDFSDVEYTTKQEEENFVYYIEHTGSGVIESIYYTYINNSIDFPHYQRNAYARSLDNHRLVDFSL